MKRFLRTALFLLLAPPLGAATITVKPGESIQTAVDLAGPGGVVKVMPGVYSEVVTIPATHVGLTLTGAKKKGVVLDARAPGGEGRGPGILVLAPEVKIAKLTVRHARTDPVSGAPGHGIRVEGDLCTIDRVTVVRSQQDGVSIAADGVTVRRSLLFGNGKRGIDAKGDDILVDDCEIRQHKDGGVRIDGDDAEVEDCEIVSVKEGEGIEISGDEAEIDENHIVAAFQESIQVDGDEAEIDHNLIEFGGDDGIDITGSQFVCSKNKIFYLLGPGDALRADAAVSGGLFAKNKVRGTSEAGAKITNSVGVRIEGNKFEDCGADKRPTINIADSCQNCEAVSNKIRGAQGDAIRLDGLGNLAEANDIDGALEDGVDIQGGTGNVARSNLIRRCHAEGLENNGLNSVAVTNVLEDNRIDFANDGTFAIEAGNVFTTGGVTTPPEIDN